MGLTPLDLYQFNIAESANMKARDGESPAKVAIFLNNIR